MNESTGIMLSELDESVEPWWVDKEPTRLPPLPPGPAADVWLTGKPLDEDLFEAWFEQAEIDQAIRTGGEVMVGEVDRWRGRLGETGMPSGQAGLIDLLRVLEELKSCAAAVQARAAVALESARKQAEADRGVRQARRGVGLGTEVGLARRESPFRGSILLGLAKALVMEMPRTLAALQAGALNEWRATLIARETQCLDPVKRAEVDAWFEEFLTAHQAMSTKRMVAEVRRKVAALDPAAVVRRKSAATGGRRVGLQPLPDGMVRLTAILGLQEGDCCTSR